jgi:hypothetical protein
MAPPKHWNPWTEAEDNLLRPLVGKDEGGENDEVPPLNWRQVATWMNDYVEENGHFANSDRVYPSGMVNLRWKGLHRNVSRTGVDAEERPVGKGWQDGDSNVDRECLEVEESHRGQMS